MRKLPIYPDDLLGILNEMMINADCRNCDALGMGDNEMAVYWDGYKDALMVLKEGLGLD